MVGIGIQQIAGGKDNDALTGSTVFADRLAGGDGDDRFVPGGGADSMFGGDGNDTYVFATPAEWSGDTITEAAGEGVDVLDLSAVSDILTVEFHPSDTASGLKVSLQVPRPQQPGSIWKRYLAERATTFIASFDNWGRETTTPASQPLQRHCR